MSKRVSNKKGTTHRKGIKPARSRSTWARHQRKILNRKARDRMEELRQISRENIARRFSFGKDGGSND